MGDSPLTDRKWTVSLDQTQLLTPSNNNKNEPADPHFPYSQGPSSQSLLAILLYGIPVILCTAGSTVFLLAYIFIINDWQFDPNGRQAILSTADLQNVLTISQVSTTAVSVTVPIVVTVLAYQLASEWLKASAEGTEDTPSPLQLGILVSALQGSNIIAFAKARLSLFQLSRESSDQVVKTPRILKKALQVLGGLIGLSYGIAFTDSCLHIASRAATVTRASPYLSSTQAYGREINSTYCASLDHPAANPTGTAASIGITTLCGLLVPDIRQWGVSAPEGLRTLSNSSSLNKVALADDQTAILVPSSPPMNATYVAFTIGVYSSCQSVMANCVQPEGGSDEGPDIDCTRSQRRLNITSNSLEDAISNQSLLDFNLPFGVVNASTGSIANGAWADHAASFQWATSNPFPFATVVVSQAYDTASTNPANATSNWLDNNGWIGETGFYSQGLIGAWNVLYCNISIREVQYRYANPSSSSSSSSPGDGAYTIESWNLAPLHLTSLMATYIDSPYMSKYVPERVEGAGLSSSSISYEDAFALELSRELVAFSSSIWAPSSVLDIQSRNESLGSRIQLVPLTLYVSAVLLYCAITVVLTVTAAIASTSSPFVHLAQARLTSATPFIHQSFGNMEGERTWREGGLGLFGPLRADSRHRLSIGPIRTDQGETIFGVSRVKNPDGTLRLK